MEKNFQIISVQGNGRDGPAPHNFFGLKWKVLLLTSLILIAIVVSFTSITYLSLIHDFESQRSAQHQRYASEVEGLMDQISRNLPQFAELLPSLEGMDTGLLDGSTVKIAEAFDPYWASLQLNKGIELLRFYDQSSRLLVGWGAPESAMYDKIMLGWVREVNGQEKPISPRACQKDCMQFAVAPLLVEGSSVGVIFYGEKGALQIQGGNAYKIFDLKNKLVKNVENDVTVDPRNASNPSQQLDAYHILNFFDGIRKGAPQNADILGGHKSTLLVQLGNIAQRSGQTLTIDPSNGHIVNDKEAKKFWSREYEPGWEPKV